MDGFDGYIFVTGEYNHSIPGALKNAVDYLYREWNNKAAGFVSYGSSGGSGPSNTSAELPQSCRWRTSGPRSPCPWPQNS